MTSRTLVPSPARLGLVRPHAESDLERLGWTGEDSTDVRWALSRAPDPDLALSQTVRLYDLLDEAERTELDNKLRHNTTLQGRLFGVLGASSALGDHVIARPSKWRLLEAELPTAELLFSRMLSSVHASPELSPASAALDAPGVYRAGITGAEVVPLLRETYTDQLLIISAYDLASTVSDEPVISYEEVTKFLSDLADAALTAALAVSVARVFPDEVCNTRLAVIAMGKCGAQELNFVSDVDVVFVAEPVTPQATRLAAEMMRIGSMAFFDVDAGLRPEGKSGELVRSLESTVCYYKKWAKTWEFQALLKGRPMTGDLELGEAWKDALNPTVWIARERDDFVADVQKMRRRVEENIPAEMKDRELKLGRGGLRDVEFAVQLLQMVHGRMDESLRVRGTVEALDALIDGGYIGRSDGANLIASYKFIRLLEHRLQLQRLKRTHSLPLVDDTESYRWLARAAHVRPDGSHDAVGVLRVELKKNSARIRRLHQQLFYRPILAAFASSDADTVRLSSAAAIRVLRVLGYGSPDNAYAHLLALTSRSNRRGRIQALILPMLLEWLSRTPNPDGGLLNYRRMSEELEDRIWYLRTLRDDPSVAKKLMFVCGNSDYIPQLLTHAPEVLRLYTDGATGSPLVQVDPEVSAKGLVASTKRYQNLDRVIAVARSLRRAELARIASADILGLLPVPDVCLALSTVWLAVLEAALQAVIRQSLEENEWTVAPARISVIGMGRLGGREIGYGSDADVMFVCEPITVLDEKTGERVNVYDKPVGWATTVAKRVGALLAKPSTDPPLDLDTDLRPEGRNGPLVRSLDSYSTYYSKWAQTWEIQALLRADIVAGDRELGLKFLHLIDNYRYPVDGIPEETVREIRVMKARVDRERMPRGADPTTHTKLGRGGLSDIEWTVQLLTLQYGSTVPGLHNTSTLESLAAAAEAGVISDHDASMLREAWIVVTRARNALVLVRGKPTDQLPRQGDLLAAVASIEGFEWHDTDAYLDHYLRVTRHARRVVDRLFWGE